MKIIECRNDFCETLNDSKNKKCWKCGKALPREKLKDKKDNKK